MNYMHMIQESHEAGVSIEEEDGWGMTPLHIGKTFKK